MAYPFSFSGPLVEEGLKPIPICIEAVHQSVVVPFLAVLLPIMKMKKDKSYMSFFLSLELSYSLVLPVKAPVILGSYLAM